MHIVHDRDTGLRSLPLLREFFQRGRNKHGGHMNPNEDALNSIQRNLSLFTDEELIQLIYAANEFIIQAKYEYESRDAD